MNKSFKEGNEWQLGTIVDTLLLRLFLIQVACSLHNDFVILTVN